MKGRARGPGVLQRMAADAGARGFCSGWHRMAADGGRALAGRADEAALLADHVDGVVHLRAEAAVRG